MENAKTRDLLQTKIAIEPMVFTSSMYTWFLFHKHGADQPQASPFKLCLSNLSNKMVISKLYQPPMVASTVYKVPRLISCLTFLMNMDQRVSITRPYPNP